MKDSKKKLMDKCEYGQTGNNSFLLSKIEVPGVRRALQSNTSQYSACQTNIEQEKRGWKDGVTVLSVVSNLTQACNRGIRRRRAILKS